MSSNQSNLSSSRYGYDFVVATTQKSINATMQEYLNGLPSPEVTMCYIMDVKGVPQLIDYQKLIDLANGTDPFTVPDGANPITSLELKNLSGAWFMYAFRAQIGLPPGYAPLTKGGPPLPDIVVLGADTSAVTYNLTCSEFTVVGAIYGPRGIVSWLNQSQPSGKAWIFSSKVDLRLTTTDETDYKYLPKDVQEQIKNLGGDAFSIQQLLFDLDNAALETVPTIPGMDTGSALYGCLNTMFLGKYFNAMKANGQPVLGCAITQSTAPPSTLIMTDLNMEVNPFIGTITPDPNRKPPLVPALVPADYATLCYLCAANGATLPVATQFSWNWIDPSYPLLENYDGVISINRNTFVKYLETQLYDYVSSNCYQTHSNVTHTGGGTKIHYQGTLDQNQTPKTVAYPLTGQTVLQFMYDSESYDEAGLKSTPLGQMWLNSTFSLDVNFLGNQIIFVQHLVLYLKVERFELKTYKVDANIFDKTITDTFTLSVDQNGKLIFTCGSNTVDNSKSPDVSDWTNFFAHLGNVVDNFETWASKQFKTTFTDIPLNFAQAFIFPGGNTFTFQSVEFSDNQDLASHITYVQPS